MPSRFCFYDEPEDIINRFPISQVNIDYYKNYNIKPTNRVVGIVQNDGKNEVVRLRWGFVKGNKFFKARAETVHEKRLFSKAFRERRCLILVNGFFEWEKVDGKSIPYYFKMRDDSSFAIAGLYNSYIDEEDDNKKKYQFSVITAEANELVGRIFHRMPVILEKGEEATWLNPPTHENELRSLLLTYPAGEMESYRVRELPARRDRGPDTIAPYNPSSVDEFF